MDTRYPLSVQFDELIKKWSRVLNSAIEKGPQRTDSPSKEGVIIPIRQLDDVLFRLRLWAGDVATKHGNGGPVSTVATLEMLEAIGSDEAVVLRDIFSRMYDIATEFEGQLESLSDKTILDKAEDMSRAIDDLDMHRDGIREKTSKFGGQYKSNKPIAVLCFDGGGLRSYASLLVLRELMAELSSLSSRTRISLKADTNELRPRDFFDFIFGSSSGGLIAILLGRLQMTVDECIERFESYAKDIFANEDGVSGKLHQLRMPFRGSKYGEKGLEKALQRAILEFDPSPIMEEWKKDRFGLPGDSCHTGVIATQVERPGNAPSPYIFRTYDNSASKWPLGSSLSDPYTILDVAKSTTAAPPYFKPFKLQGAVYIDGGFNNPSELAWKEVKSCLNLETRNSSRGVILVSLGTGHAESTAHAGKYKWLLPVGNMRKYAKLAERLLTDTETAHHNLKSELKDNYFRFDVKGIGHISLDDWGVEYRNGKKRAAPLDEIRAAVRAHVANTRDEIHKCAACLLSYRRDFTDAQKDEKEGLWVVPFGRNRHFVGRELIMRELLQTIPPSVDKDDCQLTAIEGLGGIGKTQIALEAAFRVYHEYPGCSVFWVPAVDATSFENAYREIGRRLNVHGIDDNAADVKVLVRNALGRESTGTWLLIVDNVDDPDLLFGNAMLSEFLPFSLKGSILFTTRNHNVAVRLGIGKLFAAEAMSRAEAIKLLEVHLNESQTRDLESMNELVNMLGDLPLAIVQASAYLDSTGTLPVQFLKHCQSSNKDLIRLLSKQFEDRGRYKSLENPIATTWLISFRHILRDHSLAARYLRFLCLLAEKGIPASLLPPEDKLDMGEAIGTLKAYAFIIERDESQVFDIHRLVRLAMQNFLRQQGELAECTTEVIRRLSEVFRFPSHENRNVWMKYLPHAQSALEFQEHCTDKEAESNLLQSVGWGLSILGDYRNSERMHRQALELWKTWLGKDNSSRLAGMNSLASTLDSQGKYEEAEQIYRQTFTLRQQVLGREHPDTLSSMSNLANMLDNQGKYEEAEAMHREVLVLRKKMQGEDHPNTLATMNNLAFILHNQGRYGEAEEILQHTIRLKNRVLGNEHPDTLTSVSNLATILGDQGRYGEAEQMLKHAVTLKKKALGESHPNTLTSMSDLGNILNCQGRFEEADDMHRQVLVWRENVLGSNHPDTLATMTNLALVLKDQGRQEEADKIQREALARRKAAPSQHKESVTEPSRYDSSSTHDLVRIRASCQVAIDRTLGILGAIMETCDKYLHLQDDNLPSVFHKVGQFLLLAQRSLEAVKSGISGGSVGEDSYTAMKRLTESIEEKAQRLGDIFETVASPPDSSRIARYHTAVRRQGRGSQVEILMRELLEDIRILLADDAIRGEAEDQANDFDVAIHELSGMEPSVPKEQSDAAISNFGSRQQVNLGSGSQNINAGSGKQYFGEVVHFGNFHFSEG